MRAGIKDVRRSNVRHDIKAINKVMSSGGVLALMTDVTNRVAVSAGEEFTAKTWRTGWVALGRVTMKENVFLRGANGREAADRLTAAAFAHAKAVK